MIKSKTRQTPPLSRNFLWRKIHANHLHSPDFCCEHFWRPLNKKKIGQKNSQSPHHQETRPSPTACFDRRCRTEAGCRHGQPVGSLPRSSGGRLDGIAIWPKPAPKKGEIAGPNWKKMMMRMSEVYVNLVNLNIEMHLFAFFFCDFGSVDEP